MINCTYMTEAPHIHAHYLSTDEMMDEEGYADLELCCHGCRSTVIYRYSNRAMREFEQAVLRGEGDPGLGHPRIRELRDEFLERHEGCLSPKRSAIFATICPNNGKLMNFVDLREEGL